MKADCHMHMVLSGGYWKAAMEQHIPTPNEAFIRSALKAWQDQGYTYLRDGGDRLGASAKARELAPEYGITYRTPLSPLSKVGHYGAFIGTVYNNLKEYAALVVEQKQKGADFIKIMISGLMDFNQYGVLTEPGMDPREIKELIHIAHEEGMAVMAHANGGDTVEAASAYGVDSVEHGAYLHDGALRAMEENGTVWVPTLSTIGNLVGEGRFPDEAVIPILESALENLQKYNGFVAPGTDAGAWAVPHGSETERPLLYRAGIDDDRLAEGTAVIMEKF